MIKWTVEYDSEGVPTAFRLVVECRRSITYWGNKTLRFKDVMAMAERTKDSLRRMVEPKEKE